MKNPVKKTFRLCLILFAAVQLPLSAKNSKEFLKPWDDGPLKWSDYHAADYPAGLNYTSQSFFIVSHESKKVKIDNYKIVYYSVGCSLIKEKSTYDPLRANEWDLRTNQVIFNIWELNTRYAQKRSFGETTQGFYKIKSDYQDKAEKQIEEFMQESSKGTDTTVVKKYEETILKELDRNPRREPDMSLAGKVPGMASLYFSYEHGIFLGGASDMIMPTNGFSMGIGYINKKDWYFDFGLTGHFTHLKVNDYYYDTQYDYQWNKNKSTNLLRIYLNCGHIVRSNQYYRLIPYAGVAFSELSQQSNTLDPKSKNNQSYCKSALSGLCVQAGINAVWIFRHTIRPDEVVDNSLRFKLYGAYDNLSGGKRLWSINMGVTINFDFMDYNSPMFVYIPVIPIIL